MKRLFDNQKIIMAASIVAISLAAAFVILSGIVGVGRPGQQQPLFNLPDAKFLYIVGKNWLAGMNPYDSQIVCQILPNACDPNYRFAYPPTLALFLILLALFKWGSVAVFVLIANVFSLIILTFFCLRLLASSVGEGSCLTDLRKSLFIMMVVGNIPVSSVFWLGQTSIIIAALMVMSFYFYQQGRDRVSGLCLALALIKPHLSYPLLFWFLLEGKSRIILSVLMVSLGLFLVPAALIGPERILVEWIKGISEYLDHPGIQSSHFFLRLIDDVLIWVGLGAYAAGVGVLISLGLIWYCQLFCVKCS